MLLSCTFFMQRFGRTISSIIQMIQWTITYRSEWEIFYRSPEWQQFWMNSSVVYYPNSNVPNPTPFSYRLCILVQIFSFDRNVIANQQKPTFANMLVFIIIMKWWSGLLYDLRLMLETFLLASKILVLINALQHPLCILVYFSYILLL